MTKVLKTINEKILHENISLIPTMGALHQGHLSLVNIGQNNKNMKTLVSIFINRRQFNEELDFINYPVDLERDIELLTQMNVDYIFIPTEAYLFPKDLENTVLSGKLGNLYEGLSRPGHFDGVLTVVNRLFELIKPKEAIFGKKDAQQLFLIRKMVISSDLNVVIKEGDIIRELNGLAKSSRNRRLTEKGKETAAQIFSNLQKTKEKLVSTANIEDSLEYGRTLFDMSEIKLDYLDIVDRDKFNFDNKNSKKLLLIIAAYVENIRLIDNIEINL